MIIYPDVTPLSADAGTSRIVLTNNTWDAWSVAASFGTDVVFGLMARLPPAIPSGTPTLSIDFWANATTGDLVWNPAYGFEGDGDTDPSLTAEGNQTMTWATGDDWELKQDSVVLDAVSWTGQAGKIWRCKLTFVASSSDLAVVGHFRPYLTFE